MINKKKLKKIHQMFFGYLQFPDNSKIIELINEKEAREKENDDEYNVEVYSKSEMMKGSKALFRLMEKINNEIYFYGQITGIQLVVKKRFGMIDAGSYNLKFPYILNTGANLQEIEKLFYNKDYETILLIYTKLDWIEMLGRTGLPEVLKQAGEIRYIANSFWILEGFECKKVEISPNVLTYGAGLNINRMMYLEALSIKIE